MRSVSPALWALWSVRFGVAAGAAGRPTPYVPARIGGWPGWLSGPLHGLGVGIGSSSFQVLTLVMCAGYVAALLAARRPARQGDRACDLGGQPLLAARAAAHLPRRLWLPRVCSPGGAAWTGSLHPRRGGSSNRCRVSVHRLAVPAFSLRAPVHARHLSACLARAWRRAVGSQAGGCREQPRGGGPDCERGTHDGTLGQGGGACSSA